MGLSVNVCKETLLWDSKLCKLLLTVCFQWHPGSISLNVTTATTTNFHSLCIVTGRRGTIGGASGMMEPEEFMVTERVQRAQGVRRSSPSHETWGIFSPLRIIEMWVFGSLVMCSLELLCLEDTSVRNSWEPYFMCFITGSYTTKFRPLLPRER